MTTFDEKNQNLSEFALLMTGGLMPTFGGKMGQTWICENAHRACSDAEIVAHLVCFGMKRKHGMRETKMVLNRSAKPHDRLKKAGSAVSCADLHS